MLVILYRDRSARVLIWGEGFLLKNHNPQKSTGLSDHEDDAHFRDTQQTLDIDSGIEAMESEEAEGEVPVSRRCI